MKAVEFLERQYNFNKQLFKSDFKQAYKIENDALQEHWEDCENVMKQSIYWNNKKMQKEQSQEKDNQSLEEFINSQPYYGHCTPEYLEGIEVGAKWQEEQSKETQKLTMINALVEFSKAHFDIHTEEAISYITDKAEQYYHELNKSE